MLTGEQVQFFKENGYLKIPGAIAPDEVQRLRDATKVLIDNGPTAEMTPGQCKDFSYGQVSGVKEPVLGRIEFLIGKGDPFVHLLAHPAILDAAYKIVGEQFVPTFDSVVVKMPGNGIEVAWHRDSGGADYYDDPETGRRLPAVNIDIYLDESNEKSGALWVIPGSVHEEVDRQVELRAMGTYKDVPGAVMVPMQPGDVLLHNVLLYHGSPEVHGGLLRRVIYYEFRDMRFIDALHRPQLGDPVHRTKWPQEWTHKRLALLQHAMDKRRAAGMEVLFSEHPAPELRVPSEDATEINPRVAHPGWDEDAEAEFMANVEASKQESLVGA